ncbi:hypothetical protein P4S73_21935 [Paraglaciecola sp. Hal342]
MANKFLRYADELEKQFKSVQFFKRDKQV